MRCRRTRTMGGIRRLLILEGTAYPFRPSTGSFPAGHLAYPAGWSPEGVTNPDTMPECPHSGGAA